MVEEAKRGVLSILTVHLPSPPLRDWSLAAPWSHVLLESLGDATVTDLESG